MTTSLMTSSKAKHRNGRLSNLRDINQDNGKMLFRVHVSIKTNAVGYITNLLLWNETNQLEKNFVPKKYYHQNNNDQAMHFAIPIFHNQ